MAAPPRSPFGDRLGDISHIGDVPEVPSSPPLRPETANLAFCPLLSERTTKNLCGDVVCRGCEFLDEEFGPLQAWLCTICSEDVEKEPYWSNGTCAGCGHYSSILVLVTT